MSATFVAIRAVIQLIIKTYLRYVLFQLNSSVVIAFGVTQQLSDYHFQAKLTILQESLVYLIRAVLRILAPSFSVLSNRAMN